MTTHTTEKGIKQLICTALTGAPCNRGEDAGGRVGERPSVYAAG